MINVEHILRRYTSCIARLRWHRRTSGSPLLEAGASQVTVGTTTPMIVYFSFVEDTEWIGVQPRILDWMLGIVAATSVFTLGSNLFYQQLLRRSIHTRAGGNNNTVYSVAFGFDETLACRSTRSMHNLLACPFSARSMHCDSIDGVSWRVIIGERVYLLTPPCPTICPSPD